MKKSDSFMHIAVERSFSVIFNSLMWIQYKLVLYGQQHPIRDSNLNYAIFGHKFNLESAPARPCPLPIVLTGGDEGKEGGGRIMRKTIGRDHSMPLLRGVS